MPGFVVRSLIAAAGLWVASCLVSGFTIVGWPTLLLAGLLLGIVNGFVRPLVVFLTLPLTIVTLGLFLFVVNAAMVGLVAALLENFTIAGFWSALFGALLVSVVSWIASSFIGPTGRYELLVVRREAPLRG
jgi:putative membrane protein